MTQIVGRGSLRPLTVAVLLLSPSGKEQHSTFRASLCAGVTKEDYYLLVICNDNDDDVVLLSAMNK